jgi:hypothetical protein
MSHRHERCIRIFLVLHGWDARAAGAEVSTGSVEDSKAQHGQKVHMDLGMYGRIMIMMVIVIVTVISTLEHISFVRSPAPLELSVFLASAYYLQSIHALVFPLLMWIFFQIPFSSSSSECCDTSVICKQQPLHRISKCALTAR